MARKKLPAGEKLKPLTIYIQEKHFDKEEELLEIAYNAIISHVTNEKQK